MEEGGEDEGGGGGSSGELVKDLIVRYATNLYYINIHIFCKVTSNFKLS